MGVTKVDRVVWRILLVFAVLVAMIAQLCLLLWGGDGALCQWERWLGFGLCILVLVILLGVKVD